MHSLTCRSMLLAELIGPMSLRATPTGRSLNRACSRCDLAFAGRRIVVRGAWCSYLDRGESRRRRSLLTFSPAHNPTLWSTTLNLRNRRAPVKPTESWSCRTWAPLWLSSAWPASHTPCSAEALERVSCAAPGGLRRPMWRSPPTCCRPHATGSPGSPRRSRRADGAPRRRRTRVAGRNRVSEPRCGVGPLA